MILAVGGDLASIWGLVEPGYPGDLDFLAPTAPVVPAAAVVAINLT